MKTIILSIIFLLVTNFAKAQQKIKVDPMMLIQLRIPIQPGDTAYDVAKATQDLTRDSN